MRAIALLPLSALAMLAACGDAETGKNAARTKAASLAAGQWELASEVTSFEVVDGGRAQIDTPVGTRAAETVCVGAGRPPTAFFSGEGYRCRYDNYYVRNGRLNVTMICSREGLSGQIPIAADGRFEEESLEYSRDVSTSLAGDGDVRIALSVTGRRTGECAPDAAGGNQSAPEAG